MILWLVLFLLIIAASFILALQSMRDYQEIPQKSQEEYSLYLVRQTKGLNENVLDLICENLGNKGLIFSVERLVKGGKSALVLFGPKRILDNFIRDLDLLELEDYSQDLDQTNILAWEVNVKAPVKISWPKLDHHEQFWFQVVIGENFRTQIRAAIYSQDAEKRKTFPDHLQKLSASHLMKMPVPFSSDQILEFYRLRTLTKSSKAKTAVMNSKGILQLIAVN